MMHHHCFIPIESYTVMLLEPSQFGHAANYNA